MIIHFQVSAIGQINLQTIEKKPFLQTFMIWMGYTLLYLYQPNEFDYGLVKVDFGSQGQSGALDFCQKAEK